jgi:hypothetical protein
MINGVSEGEHTVVDKFIEVIINIKNADGELLDTDTIKWKHYDIYDLHEDIIYIILTQCDKSDIWNFFLALKPLTVIYSDYLWRRLFDKLFPDVNNLLSTIDYGSHIFDNIKFIENHKDCILCKTHFHHNDDIMKQHAYLKCGHHNFHLNCILETKEENIKCPVCDAEYKNYEIELEPANIITQEDYSYLLNNGYVTHDMFNNPQNKTRYHKKRLFRWLHYNFMYDESSTQMLNNIHLYETHNKFYAVDYVVYRLLSMNNFKPALINLLLQRCNNILGLPVIKYIMSNNNIEPIKIDYFRHDYKLFKNYLRYSTNNSHINNLLLINKKFEETKEQLFIEKLKRYELIQYIPTKKLYPIVINDLSKNRFVKVTKIYFDLLDQDNILDKIIDYVDNMDNNITNYNHEQKNIQHHLIQNYNFKIHKLDSPENSLQPFKSYHNSNLRNTMLKIIPYCPMNIYSLLGITSQSDSDVDDVFNIFCTKLNITIDDIRVDEISEKTLYVLNGKIKKIEDDLKSKSSDSKYNRMDLYSHPTYRNIRRFLIHSVDIDFLSTFIKRTVMDTRSIKINFRLLNILLRYKFSDDKLKKIYADGVVFDSEWKDNGGKLYMYIKKNILEKEE